MTIAEREREKYERMWGTVPEYRAKCPGEAEVPEIVREFDLQLGDTVLDFGCGTGRAARALIERGIAGIGVDLAANCLDAGIDVPFEPACLWELPKNLRADYGICVDVMEHIPPEKVERTLRELARCVRRALYFVIDTSTDSFGKRIGETLHLTVRDAAWWSEMIEANVPAKIRTVVRFR